MFFILTWEWAVEGAMVGTDSRAIQSPLWPCCAVPCRAAGQRPRLSLRQPAFTQRPSVPRQPPADNPCFLSPLAGWFLFSIVVWCAPLAVCRLPNRTATIVSSSGPVLRRKQNKNDHCFHFRASYFPRTIRRSVSTDSVKARHDIFREQ